MNTCLSAALLITCFLCSGQEHYRIDWNKTPVNPLPYAYTANHHLLKGNVKSVTTKFNDGFTSYMEFDEGGIMKYFNYKDSSDVMADTFVYDSERELIKIYSLTNDEKNVAFLTLNNLKQVISSKDLFNITDGFLYNDKGFFISKKGSASYVYNSDGQLIKNTGVNNIYLSRYEYKREQGNLRVNILTETKYASPDSIIQIYNPDGELIYHKSSFFEVGYSYQTDAKGNWVSKTTREVELKTRKTKTETDTRIIEYYR